MIQRRPLHGSSTSLMRTITADCAGQIEYDHMHVRNADTTLTGSPPADCPAILVASQWRLNRRHRMPVEDQRPLHADLIAALRSIHQLCTNPFEDRSTAWPKPIAIAHQIQRRPAAMKSRDATHLVDDGNATTPGKPSVELTDPRNARFARCRRNGRW